MDNTLTGAIPPGDAYNPEMNAAKPATTKKRDVKNTWKFLGSTTALLVALGALLNQGQVLGESFKDMFNMFRPATSELTEDKPVIIDPSKNVAALWTEDKPVIIDPSKNVAAFTIEICDSTQELGGTVHLALLLEKTREEHMTAFVLKKLVKGCRLEAGHVLMNPNDFDKYIEHPRKASFKLTYSKAALYALDELVERAVEQSGAESSVN